jgi:hypothetical protein
MTSPAQDLREMPEMSPDPRIRVFRLVLHGFEEFEGMENAQAILRWLMTA